MNIDFDKIKDAVTKAAIKVKDTSENVIETAKCKYKIGEIKSDIDKKYKKIGMLVCDDENTDIEEEIRTLCIEIKELKSQLEDLENIVNDNFNKKLCPECQGKVSKEDVFCPKCGYSFENE